MRTPPLSLFLACAACACHTAAGEPRVAWLDSLHAGVNSAIQRNVEGFDTWAADQRMEPLPVPPTRVRITPYLVLRGDSGLRLSLDPELDVRLRLPNLERRWGLFIESSRGDQLPGTDPSRRESGSQVGLRNIWEKAYLQADAGVRVRTNPVLFGRIEWRPEWTWKQLFVVPRQRVFYDTTQGWGSLSTLTLHRWFGADKDTFIQALAAAKTTTRSTDGLEWETSLTTGWIGDLIEPRWKWKRVPGVRDMALGHALRYSVFGHRRHGSVRIDRHRIGYFHRRPLYKDWLYLEVEPAMEYLKDGDWEFQPVLTVGIDALFWGASPR